MEWKWLILFLLLSNIIINILLTQKKKKTLSEPIEEEDIASPPTPPRTIGPCGLGCITWLAKNKVCSKQDVENINKGLPITPTCAFAIAGCATAYCCSPFCSKKQTTCGGAPPPTNNTAIQNIDGIYNLGYYFPI